MLRFSWLAVLLAAACLACAGAQKPVTEWYYSAWFSASGAGSKGGFERARNACLERTGVTDATAVEPGSSTERAYIQCMNSAQWCTTTHPCD